MRFWTWTLLASFGLYCQAEVRFLDRPGCSEQYGTLGLEIPNRSEYTLAIETPRMYLAIGEEGRLEAFDKKTGQYLGWVGMTVGNLGYHSAVRRLPRKDGPYRKPAHLPIYFTNARERGLGTEAKYAAMRYAFEVEKADAVIAIVEENNAASRNLHLKLGFQELGIENHFITYGLSRPQFEIARRAFAAEDAQSFLPRGSGPVKVVPVTEWVTKEPNLVDTVFTDFLIELERGMGTDPSLKDTAYRHGEDLQRHLRTYSQSLEPKRQALKSEREAALAGAGSKGARGQIEEKYFNDLARLEGPLADALLHDYLTQPDFQKELKGKVADPWLARLETLEDKGLSGMAKSAVKLRMRQVLRDLKQPGRVEKLTRMKIIVTP